MNITYFGRARKCHPYDGGQTGPPKGREKERGRDSFFTNHPCPSFGKGGERDYHSETPSSYDGVTLGGRSNFSPPPGRRGRGGGGRRKRRGEDSLLEIDDLP